MSNTNPASYANIFNRPSLLLLGLTPAIMVLLAWDFGNVMSSYRGFMRGNSIPVTVVQLTFIGFAVWRGFSPISAFVHLQPITKTGFLLLHLIMCWTAIGVASSGLAAALGISVIYVHLTFWLACMFEADQWSAIDEKRFWAATGWGIVGYALLWLANILFYHPQGDDWVWFVPALTNIRWIGFFALAGFCGGLGTFTTSSGGQIDRGRIALPLLFCSLGCFLALWTASRGAILAIIIATSFAVYAAKDRKSVAATLLIAFVIAIAVTAALPAPHPIYGLERLFGSALQSGDIGELSSGRIQTWTDTIAKIGVRPWLGWGIDQFRFSGPEATLGFRHPHQSILQLLFATGVAGVVALTLIAAPFAPLLRRFPMVFVSSSHLAAGSFLVAGTVYGLYDGFFYYAYPVMIYLVAMAILVKSQPSPIATDTSD